jgi:hypothetical protein
MRERNPWNSEFTGIFEERKVRDSEQRIKDMTDLKKGIGGALGAGVGALAGGAPGAVIGGEIGSNLDKEEKMKKAAPIKLPTAYKESNSELKSLIKSIDRVLKSMGEAPNAGLKTKKVTQGKDGKSFPTKNVPKPTTKKSC